MSVDPFINDDDDEDVVTLSPDESEEDVSSDDEDADDSAINGDDQVERDGPKRTKNNVNYEEQRDTFNDEDIVVALINYDGDVEVDFNKRGTASLNNLFHNELANSTFSINLSAATHHGLRIIKPTRNIRNKPPELGTFMALLIRWASVRDYGEHPKPGKSKGTLPSNIATGKKIKSLMRDVKAIKKGVGAPVLRESLYLAVARNMDNNTWLNAEGKIEQLRVENLYFTFSDASAIGNNNYMVDLKFVYDIPGVGSKTYDLLPLISAPKKTQSFCKNHKECQQLLAYAKDFKNSEFNRAFSVELSDLNSSSGAHTDADGLANSVLHDSDSHSNANDTVSPNDSNTNAGATAPNDSNSHSNGNDATFQNDSDLHSNDPTNNSNTDNVLNSYRVQIADSAEFQTQQDTHPSGLKFISKFTGKDFASVRAKIKDINVSLKSHNVVLERDKSIRSVAQYVFAIEMNKLTNNLFSTQPDKLVLNADIKHFKDVKTSGTKKDKLQQILDAFEGSSNDTPGTSNASNAILGGSDGSSSAVGNSSGSNVILGAGAGSIATIKGNSGAKAAGSKTNGLFHKFSSPKINIPTVLARSHSWSAPIFRYHQIQTDADRSAWLVWHQLCILMPCDGYNVEEDEQAASNDLTLMKEIQKLNKPSSLFPNQPHQPKSNLVGTTPVVPGMSVVVAEEATVTLPKFSNDVKNNIKPFPYIATVQITGSHLIVPHLITSVVKNPRKITAKSDRVFKLTFTGPYVSNNDIRVVGHPTWNVSLDTNISAGQQIIIYAYLTNATNRYLLTADSSRVLHADIMLNDYTEKLKKYFIEHPPLDQLKSFLLLNSTSKIASLNQTVVIAEIVNDAKRRIENKQLTCSAEVMYIKPPTSLLGRFKTEKFHMCSDVVQAVSQSYPADKKQLVAAMQGLITGLVNEQNVINKIQHAIQNDMTVGALVTVKPEAWEKALKSAQGLWGRKDQNTLNNQVSRLLQLSRERDIFVIEATSNKRKLEFRCGSQKVKIAWADDKPSLEFLKSDLLPGNPLRTTCLSVAQPANPATVIVQPDLAQDPPLPPGWHKVFDYESKKDYYQHENGEIAATIDDIPQQANPPTVMPQPDPAQDPPLPPGWHKVFDYGSKKDYYEHENGEIAATIDDILQPDPADPRLPNVCLKHSMRTAREPQCDLTTAPTGQSKDTIESGTGVCYLNQCYDGVTLAAYMNKNKRDYNGSAVDDSVINTLESEIKQIGVYSQNNAHRPVGFPILELENRGTLAERKNMQQKYKTFVENVAHTKPLQDAVTEAQLEKVKLENEWQAGKLSARKAEPTTLKSATKSQTTTGFQTKQIKTYIEIAVKAALDNNGSLIEVFAPFKFGDYKRQALKYAIESVLQPALAKDKKGEYINVLKKWTNQNTLDRVLVALDNDVLQMQMLGSPVLCLRPSTQHFPSGMTMFCVNTPESQPPTINYADQIKVLKNEELQRQLEDKKVDNASLALSPGQLINHHLASLRDDPKKPSLMEDYFNGQDTRMLKYFVSDDEVQTIKDAAGEPIEYKVKGLNMSIKKEQQPELWNLIESKQVHAAQRDEQTITALTEEINKMKDEMAQIDMSAVTMHACHMSKLDDLQREKNMIVDELAVATNSGSENVRAQLANDLSLLNVKITANEYIAFDQYSADQLRQFKNSMSANIVIHKSTKLHPETFKQDQWDKTYKKLKSAYMDKLELSLIKISKIPTPHDYDKLAQAERVLQDRSDRFEWEKLFLMERELVAVEKELRRCCQADYEIKFEKDLLVRKHIQIGTVSDSQSQKGVFIYTADSTDVDPIPVVKRKLISQLDNNLVQEQVVKILQNVNLDKDNIEETVKKELSRQEVHFPKYTYHSHSDDELHVRCPVAVVQSIVGDGVESKTFCTIVFDTKHEITSVDPSFLQILEKLKVPKRNHDLLPGLLSVQGPQLKVKFFKPTEVIMPDGQRHPLVFNNQVYLMEKQPRPSSDAEQEIKKLTAKWDNYVTQLYNLQQNTGNSADLDLDAIKNGHSNIQLPQRGMTSHVYSSTQASHEIKDALSKALYGARTDMTTLTKSTKNAASILKGLLDYAKSQLDQNNPLDSTEVQEYMAYFTTMVEVLEDRLETGTSNQKTSSKIVEEMFNSLDDDEQDIPTESWSAFTTTTRDTKKCLFATVDVRSVSKSDFRPEQNMPVQQMLKFTRGTENIEAFKKQNPFRVISLPYGFKYATAAVEQSIDAKTEVSKPDAIKFVCADVIELQEYIKEYNIKYPHYDVPNVLRQSLIIRAEKLETLHNNAAVEALKMYAKDSNVEKRDKTLRELKKKYDLLPKAAEIRQCIAENFTPSEIDYIHDWVNSYDNMILYLEELDQPLTAVDLNRLHEYGVKMDSKLGVHSKGVGTRSIAKMLMKAAVGSYAVAGNLMGAMGYKAEFPLLYGASVLAASYGSFQFLQNRNPHQLTRYAQFAQVMRNLSCFSMTISIACLGYGGALDKNNYIFRSLWKYIVHMLFGAFQQLSLTLSRLFRPSNETITMRSKQYNSIDPLNTIHANDTANEVTSWSEIILEWVKYFFTIIHGEEGLSWNPIYLSFKTFTEFTGLGTILRTIKEARFAGEMGFFVSEIGLQWLNVITAFVPWASQPVWLYIFGKLVAVFLRMGTVGLSAGLGSVMQSTNIASGLVAGTNAALKARDFVSHVLEYILKQKNVFEAGMVAGVLIDFVNSLLKFVIYIGDFGQKSDQDKWFKDSAGTEVNLFGGIDALGNPEGLMGMLRSPPYMLLEMFNPQALCKTVTNPTSKSVCQKFMKSAHVMIASYWSGKALLETLVDLVLITRMLSGLSADSMNLKNMLPFTDGLLGTMGLFQLPADTGLVEDPNGDDIYHDLLKSLQHDRNKQTLEWFDKESTKNTMDWGISMSSCASQFLDPLTKIFKAVNLTKGDKIDLRDADDVTHHDVEIAGPREDKYYTKDQDDKIETNDTPYTFDKINNQYTRVVDEKVETLTVTEGKNLAKLSVIKVKFPDGVEDYWPVHQLRKHSVVTNYRLLFDRLYPEIGMRPKRPQLSTKAKQDIESALKNGGVKELVTLINDADADDQTDYRNALVYLAVNHKYKTKDDITGASYMALLLRNLLENSTVYKNTENRLDHTNNFIWGTSYMDTMVSGFQGTEQDLDNAIKTTLSPMFSGQDTDKYHLKSVQKIAQTIKKWNVDPKSIETDEVTIAGRLMATAYMQMHKGKEGFGVDALNYLHTTTDEGVVQPFKSYKLLDLSAYYNQISKIRNNCKSDVKGRISNCDQNVLKDLQNNGQMREDYPFFHMFLGNGPFSPLSVDVMTLAASSYLTMYYLPGSSGQMAGYLTLANLISSGYASRVYE